MKIEEQVLSREQMAHLVELGVDTSDASMVWVVEKNDTDFKYATIIINNRYLYGTEGIYNFIPTYTIGDLIYKVNNLFKSFSFTDNKQIDTLYDCLSWMAENHKELIK